LALPTHPGTRPIRSGFYRHPLVNFGTHCVAGALGAIMITSKILARHRSGCSEFAKPWAKRQGGALLQVRLDSRDTAGTGTRPGSGMTTFGSGDGRATSVTLRTMASALATWKSRCARTYSDINAESLRLQACDDLANRTMMATFLALDACSDHNLYRNKRAWIPCLHSGPAGLADLN